MSAGLHTVVWDGHGENGRRVVPGTYLARATWDGQTATKGVCVPLMESTRGCRAFAALRLHGPPQRLVRVRRV